MRQLLHMFSDLDEDLGFQFVLRGEHLHPFRNVELNLTDRKFIENVFQDSCNIFFPKLFAVCSDRGYAKVIPQPAAELLCFFLIWCLGVDKDQEWFSLFFQFIYCECLRLGKILPRDFAEASVCSDHKPNGRVLLNHFTGANLCCFVEGNRFFKPRSPDHPFSSLFNVSRGILYEETNTVDQFYPHLLVFTEGDGNCFFRNKFGFYRGDEFPGTA